MNKTHLENATKRISTLWNQCSIKSTNSKFQNIRAVYDDNQQNYSRDSQSSVGVLKKAVLTCVEKIHRKTPATESFLGKVGSLGLQPYKKGIHGRGFPVDFATFLKTAIP